MKKFRLFIIAAAFSAIAFSASAQTKLASVDMKKVFNGYYKTKAAQVVLDKEKSDLTKEIKDMADGLDKAKSEYKQLLDQSNDQAISNDERDKRKQLAVEKAREVNGSQVALEQFQRQAEAQLADKSQRMINNLVTEIQGYVADTAKAGNYAIVLDSSANSVAGTPAVLYTDPSIDITAAVLARENAGAPIDIVKPSIFSGTNTP